MLKRMEDVEVRLADSGKVEIWQGVEEEQIVQLNPEQIDLLVKWLLEAKEKAQGG